MESVSSTQIDSITGIEAHISDGDTRRQNELNEYKQLITPLTEEVVNSFAVLWNGVDSNTHTPLTSDQVIPAMDRFIQAATALAVAKVKTPWNEEDFQTGKFNLTKLTEIKEKGPAGLLSLCEQALASIPKKKDTQKIDPPWRPTARRWQQYKKIISTQQA